MKQYRGNANRGRRDCFEVVSCLLSAPSSPLRMHCPVMNANAYSPRRGWRMMTHSRNAAVFSA